MQPVRASAESFLRLVAPDRYKNDGRFEPRPRRSGGHL